ncbi:MAG: 2OG-Fe(II) oxygenase, partial [Pirellulaceae bacterium]
MPEKEALNALLKSLRQSRFSDNFCVGGSFPIDMSSVAVEGVGTLQFPLYPRDCRPLLDIAAQAPYGRGTETIVDTSVRNTLEIPAEQVHLADHFEMRLNEALSHIAEKLHLDRNRLDCQLYKLLIYSRGGFFLPHRDSEKVPGMIATLVVVLPNPFDGGNLVVRHDQKTRYFPFDMARRKSRSRTAADIKTAEFVAFFSDCEHEVSRITSGVRLCLAFNLIIQPRPRLDRSYTDSTSDVDLRQAIEEWNEIWPDQPIVFALEHLYTNAGLAPGLLKGADATLLEQLEKVAVDLDLSLHFG